MSPHSDAQNVLVFQTAGRKRWRVWRPPPRRRGVDPFGRGKHGDAIAPAELDEPLLDAWLEPGDVLYVPIGFPHATSTEACEVVSCHVTLGLDTYFYGLCYATLRAVAIARAGGRDGVDPSRLDDALHDRLFAPLPLGFLNDGALDDAGLVDRIVDDVAALNADVAAARGVAAPSLGDAAAVRTCAEFFVDHHRALVAPAKYAGVRPPAARGSVAAAAARVAKNAKNAKEEAALRGLGTFASPPR